MTDLLLTHFVAGAVVLAAALGIFFAVNTKRPAGERHGATRSEFGTRRSRWRGYCIIGGTLMGYWVPVVLRLVWVAQNPANAPPMKNFVHEIAYSGAPMTAMAGFIVGHVMGAFSVRFIPEKLPPHDPDAG